MAPKDSYHHGNLRHALVQAALEAVAEGGAASLSVADAARRAGVTSGAPYRHFANRRALLLATAVETARMLAGDLEATRHAQPGLGPAEALAQYAAAYVRFYLRHGAGLDLIYLAELRELKDPDLADQGRRVMDLMMSPAQDIAGGAEEGIVLLEQVFAIAHGYAQLHAISLSPRRLRAGQDVAEATAATVRLVATRTAELTTTQP